MASDFVFSDRSNTLKENSVMIWIRKEKYTKKLEREELGDVLWL
jgi:hypothetical protein